MPEDVQLEHALQVANTAAKKAGKLILNAWRGEHSISHKGAIDLVTKYDLESESLIRQTILNAFPKHKIVGEESEVTGEGDHIWYIDPIDGTTNFAHGHPFFCVSIALYFKDVPKIGLVHAPALKTTWSAISGQGALRNAAPCQVSKTTELPNALCATGFPYDRWTNPDDNLAEYRAFMKRTRGIRRCGSAALDLAMVADGSYDIFWEQRLNAWDMCAGALIVQEAGGQLSDYDGSRGDPRTGRIVASNSHLHEAALEVLGEVRRELSFDTQNSG